MRIFAISPSIINITNKRQANQNSFQGKIPKSSNITDTFQKSVDKIAEEKRVNQLWDAARQFRICFFKPVYINEVEGLQQKYKEILEIKDKDEFLDKAFNELKNDYGLADVPIKLNKNFKSGTQFLNTKAAAVTTPYYSEGFIEICVDKKYSNKQLFKHLTHELRHVLQQLKIYQYGAKDDCKKVEFSKFLDAYPNTNKSDFALLRDIIDEYVNAHFDFFKNAGVKKVRKKDGGYNFVQKLLNDAKICEIKSSENYSSAFTERDAIRAENLLMRAILGE